MGCDDGIPGKTVAEEVEDEADDTKGGEGRGHKGFRVWTRPGAGAAADAMEKTGHSGGRLSGSFSYGIGGGAHVSICGKKRLLTLAMGRKGLGANAFDSGTIGTKWGGICGAAGNDCGRDIMIASTSAAVLGATEELWTPMTLLLLLLSRKT